MACQAISNNFNSCQAQAQRQLTNCQPQNQAQNCPPKQCGGTGAVKRNGGMEEQLAKLLESLGIKIPQSQPLAFSPNSNVQNKSFQF